MPPMIVAPERDVPGISANACASPTLSASVQRMASTSSMRTDAGRAPLPPLHPQDDERADDERERDRNRREQRAP